MGVGATGIVVDPGTPGAVGAIAGTGAAAAAQWRQIAMSPICPRADEANATS